MSGNKEALQVSKVAERGITIVSTDKSPVYPMLSLTEKEIVKANRDNKACHMLSDKELCVTISLLLGKVYAEIGHKPESDDLVHYADAIMDEIRSRYNFLTLSELSIMIKNGIREEYGEFITVSPKLIYGWLKLFLVKRGEAIIKQRRYEEAQELEKKKVPIKDTPAIRKELHDSLMKIITTENKLPLYWDYYSVYVHLVEDTKQVVISEEERKKFAMDKIAMINSEAKFSRDKKHRDELLKIINNKEKLKVYCRVQYIKEHLTKKHIKTKKD